MSTTKNDNTAKSNLEKEALEMKCKYIWKNNTIVNLKS